ncbi:MAG: hypothetical protein HKN11_00010, partial [Rhizobiales bacterium]|nr:hypothetical protein [Hyphomicrobiales bacterium]
MQQAEKPSLQSEPQPDADVAKRKSEIGAILAMTRTAREDALDLDLSFEAYLLDMACIALSEQMQKLR